MEYFIRQCCDCKVTLGCKTYTKDGVKMKEATCFSCVGINHPFCIKIRHDCQTTHTLCEKCASKREAQEDEEHQSLVS